MAQQHGGGPMHQPYMPPGLAGPAEAAAVAAATTMYYNNSNAYHVYYPPTAYGFPTTMATAAGSAGGNVVPVAALPAKEAIMESVKKQVDYYFSAENLSKDVFLRSKVGKRDR